MIFNILIHFRSFNFHFHFVISIFSILRPFFILPITFIFFTCFSYYFMHFLLYFSELWRFFSVSCCDEFVYNYVSSSRFNLVGYPSICSGLWLRFFSALSLGLKISFISYFYLSTYLTLTLLSLSYKATSWEATALIL